MKELIVTKFGGSSLSDSRQFKKVKEIMDANENRRYIIPSAPGRRYEDDHKVTDLLYMCYQLATHKLNIDEVFNIVKDRYIEISKGLELELDMESILEEIKENIINDGTRDYVASRGEYLNGIILANYLDFEFIDAKDVMIFDNIGNFNLKETRKKLKEKLEKVQYGVIPGFYGSKENGEIITFTRGGSDVTGSIVSNVADAKLYENWTDVSGFLIADPSIVPKSKTIHSITYRELRELSYMGAPVLHEEAIFPVKKTEIPINIRNTNRPEDLGTMIVNEDSSVNTGTITGIAGKKDFIVITVEKTRMTLEKDFLRKLISVFESNDISIEHMPSSIDSISIVVSAGEINNKLAKIKEEIRIYTKPDRIVVSSNMALIAVVGKGMIRSKGISGKIFTALAEKDINVRMITQGSSELSIIIGIENEDFRNAIEAIYRAFN